MAVSTTSFSGINTTRKRSVETGTANAILTATYTPAANERLLMVTCKYSGAATQAGVSTTLDAGAGAAYDTLLNTGTANAQNTAYLPSVPIPLMSDDAIVVVAPAGGVGVTAAITIVTESVA